MTYQTLERNAEQDRRLIVANALHYQKAAAFYADIAGKARDEGNLVYASEYQRHAASAAREAQNCVCELMGSPRDYDRPSAS